MSKRSKPKAAVRQAHPLARKFRRHWGAAFIALLFLAAVVVAWLEQSKLAPQPPKIDTAALDPAVAKLIMNTTQAVRATPRSSAAWGKLGTVLVTHGFPAEAQNAFAQAGRLSPEEPRWPYQEALAEMAAGGPPELIIARLSSATELSRNTSDAPRLRLAHFLLEHGKINEAEEHLRTLLQAKPAHPPALLDMARVRLAQGKVRESLEFANRCASEPHVARSAQALLAQLHQRLGNTAAAEAAARQSAGLAPDVPWPDPYQSDLEDVLIGKQGLMEQAQQLIEARQFDAALNMLATVTNDYPADAEGYYGIGALLNQQNRSGEAERVLREHLRLDPKSAHGYEQLAVALLAQKRYADAVPALERAIQIMPALARAHYQWAFACVHLGRHDEALTHLRDALKHNPNEADSYSLLADLLSQRERFAEAAEALERVVQLRPSWSRAFFNLGYARARLGQTDAAVAHLRTALRLGTSDVDSHILLAELLRARQETAEASKVLREALVIDPTDERAKSLLKEIEKGK